MEIEKMKNTVIIDLAEYIDLFEFKKDILSNKTIIHHGSGLIYSGIETLIHSNDDEVLRLSKNIKELVDKKNELERKTESYEKMVSTRNEQIRILKEMLSEIERLRSRELSEIAEMNTSEFKKFRTKYKIGIGLLLFDQSSFDKILEKKLKIQDYGK